MSYLPLPTAVETQTTRALITALHEEIRVLELEIQSRAAKIASIRDDIAQKESFIAPVRRLPFDVLAEIVVAAASDHATSVHALRTLSSLCKTWRDATLRTPRAWTKITFVDAFGVFDPHVARSALSSMQDVRLWFSRSGTCPVDAVFKCPGSAETEEDEIFEIVYDNASRLRTLTIYNPFPNVDAALVTKALTQPMPLLEHLGVDSYVERLDAAGRGSILQFLPRLSSIALRGSLNHVPDALRGQLRDLHIAYAQPSPILDELRTVGRYPLLQSLRLTSLHQLPDLSGGPVELGGLRVLYLGLGSIRSGPSFMHAIAVPKLERLAIRLDYTYISEMTKKDAASMLDSVFKLDPPLRELHLQGISLSDIELHKALCHLPLLEVLVMLETKSSDKLCDALSAPRRRGGWICPRLTHLCIGNATATRAHKHSVSRAGVEKVAHTRYVSGDVTTLRRVRLDTSELCYAGPTAWAWDSEERGEDDSSSDTDSTSSSDVRNHDNVFESPGKSPTVPLWWQVDVSPYFNFDPDS